MPYVVRSWQTYLFGLRQTTDLLPIHRDCQPHSCEVSQWLSLCSSAYSFLVSFDFQLICFVFLDVLYAVYVVVQLIDRGCWLPVESLLSPQLGRSSPSLTQGDASSGNGHAGIKNKQTSTPYHTIAGKQSARTSQFQTAKFPSGVSGLYLLYSVHRSHLALILCFPCHQIHPSTPPHSSLLSYNNIVHTFPELFQSFHTLISYQLGSCKI